MADLTSPGKTVYTAILTLATVNMTSTLKRVQDGAGVNSALSLSTTGARIDGTLVVTGDVTFSGQFTVGTIIGDGQGLTNSFLATHTIRTITASDPLGDSEDVVVMNGSSISLTLPQVADYEGREYVITNINGTAATVAAAGVETITGNETTGTVLTIPSNGTVKLYALADRWVFTGTGTAA